MSDLEKALARAKYSALPLPHEKTDPTTIFAFQDGQLFIVRNPHTCLTLPVTVDNSADTLQFERSFKLDFSGVVSFLVKIFSLGNAKSELEAHAISSATIQMGGLSHNTIETGALVDFLLQAQPSTCLRDILDPEHFTIIAALKASSFTYTFKNKKGVALKLSLPEVQGMFKADASLSVELTAQGSVVVNAPRYVGVITWDGKTISKEVEKARKYLSGVKRLKPFKPASAFQAALEPEEVIRRWRQSFKARAASSGR